MYAYSLINISYGERKNMLKKGEHLTADMNFQKEITDLESLASQGKEWIIYNLSFLLEETYK